MEEDDTLLHRARMLVLSANVNFNVDLSNRSQTTGSYTVEQSQAQPVEIDLSEYYNFKCGVIAGSSLVTTYSDIRPKCKQSSFVYINGYKCQIKGPGGEWAQNCIELTCDYPGDTNFDSTLSVAKINNLKAAYRYENTGIKPVASKDIIESVKSLEDIMNGFKANALPKSSSVKDMTKSNKPSSSRETLLRFGLDMSLSSNPTCSSKPSLDDDLIREELQKTQDRITEWKRKIELKLQEDTLLAQQQLQEKREERAQKRNSTTRIPQAKKRHSDADPAVSLGIKTEAKIKADEEARKLAEEKAQAEANQRKVEILRDKTLERVQLYKQQLAQQEKQTREQKQKDEEERLRRAQESLPKQRDRFLTLKQQTEERLQKLAADEFARAQETQQAAEKRLKALADQRGRQKPTSEWIGNQTEPVSIKKRGSILPPITKDGPNASTLLRAKSEQGASRPLIEASASQSMTAPSSGSFNRAQCKLESNPTHSSVSSHDEDDWSLDDDSLHGSDVKPNSLIRHSTSEAFSPEQSILSDVTEDDRASFLQRLSIPKKKKKVNPVWRLKPIPVQPYMPIPVTPELHG